MIASLSIALCGCDRGKGAASTETAGGSVLAATPAALRATSGCQLNFNADVPPDVSISSQSVADCFAWQEFVAVNWASTTGAGFGDPGDYGPVAWQGYMNNHQLFQPDGSPPPPWGTASRIDPSCLNEAGLTGNAARTAIPMTITSAIQFTEGEDSQQAAPRTGPAWVADVRGNNLWYEIRVDQDEYNAVVQNQWYNREGQAAWYRGHAGTALALPEDNPRTKTNPGAMEVKAAWMQVPDPDSPKWRSYKLSHAVVVNPTTQKCVAQTVALVGLHIIHKTQTQPTWIWATFEHVDNVPDAASAASTSNAWNFYNASCRPVQVKVPAQCQYKGQATPTVSCTPNQPPQYEIGAGCPAATPIQVTRTTPIDPNAAAANAAAKSAIQRAYPNSVWRNYRLVNVLWSTNPPSQKPTLPQLFNSPQPNGPVANTMLETYAQTLKCVDCHKGASISGDDTLPSDFSFVLHGAQPKPGAKLLLTAKRRPIIRRIDR